MVRLALCFAVALALVGGPARATLAADEPPAKSIEYAGDRLTVRLSRVALSEVLAEVGRQTGAEIRGGLVTPREVTAEFEAVPLPEALHRLLGDQNFALVYGEAGKLRAVKLLGGPQAPPPSISFATASPPTTMPRTSDPAMLVALVSSHPPVPITGRLAAALGTDSATVQQLLETALHSDDAAVRSEGVRRTLQLLEAEPDLRSAVIGAVKGMDDATLAGALRSATPTHAEEITVHVATQSKVSELRVKASGVLQQIRAQKSGG
jgi:hypothetical protein